MAKAKYDYNQVGSQENGEWNDEQVEQQQQQENERDKNSKVEADEEQTNIPITRVQPHKHTNYRSANDMRYQDAK